MDGVRNVHYVQRVLNRGACSVYSLDLYLLAIRRCLRSDQIRYERIIILIENEGNNTVEEKHKEGIPARKPKVGTSFRQNTPTIYDNKDNIQQIELVEWVFYMLAVVGNDLFYNDSD